jgi:formylglycine-generating enzyme required for sulfatase activity
MLETEVTEGQFQLVVGQNPSCNCKGGGGVDNPVECVDWPAAKAFCAKIGGRLPTEAEWEYSARGGTATPYYCNYGGCLGAIAWYYGNSGGIKHSVKGKQANPIGLYDMLGNVWEWTSDWWDDSYYGVSPPTDPTGPAGGTQRSVRGGSFSTDGWDADLRVSNRIPLSPSHASCYVGPNNDLVNVGFRCVR